MNNGTKILGNLNRQVKKVLSKPTLLNPSLPKWLGTTFQEEYGPNPSGKEELVDIITYV